MPNIKKGASETFKGFKQFILRGNVVDLAVGVVFGASFVAVINAIVKDLITPLIAAIATQPDFSALEITVRGSKIMYGDFLNAIFAFFLIASATYFFIVLPVNALVAASRKGPPADPTEKKCPQCKGDIPIDASRCMHCTQPVA
jgi:large conductance mechanosensitive channel